MESAPNSGSRTGRDAAADIVPHIVTLRARVLAYLASRGELGATAEEIQFDLHLSGNTVRPRLVELGPPPKGTDCIYRTGETRKTLSGRNAEVWRYKP
jgi:hypothetical protein